MTSENPEPWFVDDEPEDAAPAPPSRKEHRRIRRARVRAVWAGMTPRQRRMGHVVAAIQVVLLVLAALLVRAGLGPLPTPLGVVVAAAIVVGGYRHWERGLMWV